MLNSNFPSSTTHSLVLVQHPGHSDILSGDHAFVFKSQTSVKRVGCGGEAQAAGFTCLSLHLPAHQLCDLAIIPTSASLSSPICKMCVTVVIYLIGLLEP